MPNYLSLEEAAAALGVSADRLVELRSQGQVRGFRDGTSWKFPDSEIDRLKDELADEVGSGGLLVSEQELGVSGSSGSNVIGGDDSTSGTDSDLEIGSEPVGSGSDVNLVTSDSGKGSDVELVASDSGVGSESQSGIDDGLIAGSDLSIEDLVEIDSAELKLDESAISHESSHLDLAIDPKEGSTGPLKKQKSDEPVAQEDGSITDHGDGSQIGIGEDELVLAPESDGDLSFAGTIPDEDSDEVVIGDDSSAMDVLGSDIELATPSSAAGASSLELMDDLGDSGESLVMRGSSGADVLSELDLLSAEQQGSGLIRGDSKDLLVSSGLDSLSDSSGLGSSLGDDVLGDAMNDSADNDLVIADDDDDLLIDSVGSDISVAGDSGINLMSPSDSGLSLESEPLDLAGSSISALDLGAELIDGEGSGSALAMDAGGSGVNLQAEEDFQLSPSGIGLEAEESSSQVIEVEDSEAIGEAVEFEDADFAAADPMGGEVFATEEPEAVESAAIIDESPVAATGATPMTAPAGMIGGYEVPFSLFQCLALLMIISVLSLGGMLMTDLVRNMWAYTETAAPVSSLTDALISAAGLDQ